MRSVAEVVGEHEVLTPEAAALIASSASTEEREAWAARYLMDQHGELRRARRQSAERAARTWRDKPPSRWTRADHEAFEAAPEDDEAKTYHRRMQDMDLRHRAELQSRMAEIFDGFRRQVRMEWTRDLLATTFALRDGAVVSWGEATVSQHEERAGMYAEQALSGLEGMAAHSQALDELKAAGVRTLNELTGRAM